MNFDTVRSLMQEIMDLKLDKSIYELDLRCGDHYSGFRAIVTFRCAKLSFETKGDTPEEALRAMLRQLATNFAACPHCGRLAPIE